MGLLELCPCAVPVSTENGPVSRLAELEVTICPNVRTLRALVAEWGAILLSFAHYSDRSRIRFPPTATQVEPPLTRKQRKQAQYSSSFIPPGEGLSRMMQCDRYTYSSTGIRAYRPYPRRIAPSATRLYRQLLKYCSIVVWGIFSTHSLRL